MTNTAIFAAGCFWGVEEKFLSTKGIIETEVGYIGGKTKEPTYQEVCKGNTYHAEAIKIFFDENAQLIELSHFFRLHLSRAKEWIDYNPTTSLLDGLKATWAWFQDNHDEYKLKQNYFKD